MSLINDFDFYSVPDEIPAIFNGLVPQLVPGDMQSAVQYSLTVLSARYWAQETLAYEIRLIALPSALQTTRRLSPYFPPGQPQITEHDTADRHVDNTTRSVGSYFLMDRCTARR